VGLVWLSGEEGEGWDGVGWGVTGSEAVVGFHVVIF